MIGRRSLTGERCKYQEYGDQKAHGKTAVVRKQGEIMPSHRNKDASWRMIQHLPKKLK